jgi:threonine synthase
MMDSGCSKHAVRYVSTRGNAPVLPFDDVLLAGLARDGGLYVPDSWPTLSHNELRSLRRLSYPELTARIVALFAEPFISEAELALLAEDAYRGFEGYPDIAPLKPLRKGEWLLELFHGPTLAFKDYALQVLGRLFDLVLARRGERITILGATSGDTGSAAIEACRDREAVDIFVLHPKGRVSEVQRRQMTTVTSPNVHNIAIDGTFDDCQDLVKALFNDEPFRHRFQLAAVNSINWVRIAAQTVYYVHAALALGAPDQLVAFAVPTGNFGNAFAGYAAARLGVPIAKLVIGSNRNDILTRLFTTGRMEIRSVCTTLSPSMDIQISSNFERYLFELYDRDAGCVAALMRRFRDGGVFALESRQFLRAREMFAAVRCDDEETKQGIRAVYDESGYLVDPHTAIGIAAARTAALPADVPVAAIATAHPAKFPDAVEAATGIRPPLPGRLADLLRRAERYQLLPADAERLRVAIAETMGARGVNA